MVMMAKNRAESYKNKVRPFIHKGQSSRFREASCIQADLESIARTLDGCKSLSVIYRPFLHDMVKKLYKLKHQHAGDIFQQEALIERDKWLARGIDADCVNAILSYYGVIGDVVVTEEYECFVGGGAVLLMSGDYTMAGKRQTFLSRKITLMSFRLRNMFAASGPVYYRLRSPLDGSIIWETLVTDAAAIPASYIWYPVVVPGIVVPDAGCKSIFFCVEYSGANPIQVSFAEGIGCCSGCGIKSLVPDNIDFIKAAGLDPDSRITVQSL